MTDIVDQLGLATSVPGSDCMMQVRHDVLHNAMIEINHLRRDIGKLKADIIILNQMGKFKERA